MIILPNLSLFKLFRLSTLIFCLALLNACSKAKTDLYEKMDEQEIFERGKSNLLEKNYGQSIEDFEALEARFPFGPLPEQGQLAIIYTYIQKGDHLLATAAADRFIRMYPNHEHIDYVYYLKGVAHFESLYTFVYRKLPIDRAIRDPQSARAAFAEFKHLLTHYPHSKYVSDAKQRMIFLRHFLANYELHVAEYYMKRKAYISAANRCVDILEKFNGTPAIKPALEIMITAYTELGLEKLAEDAKAVLTQNK